MEARKVAVVGSGIAGLSAAWLMAKRSDVTLFEAEGRLGGHTHTVDVTLDGMTAPVDTGFMVYNDRTYPTLTALFHHLGITSTPSEMSFSVSIEQDAVEWAGNSILALFARRTNLVRPVFWIMLKEILRFNREAISSLSSGREPAGSLGEFLDRGRYGRAFRDWYLLPMAAAIWSCPTRQMMAYPAAPFLRFCHNHGLLQLNNRPQWRTVVGGAHKYVARMAAGIADVRLATPVERVRRLPRGVVLSTSAGTEHFDQVVLACHSDQALRMLADADDDEVNVLGRVRYQANRIVIHTDQTFLPRAREAWASWNYSSGRGEPAMRPVSVSYWLNALQPLPFHTPVIETLNPFREPRSSSVLARMDYSHPIFDGPALRAQEALPAIQGRRRTWFCGAWTAYGFHEDGLRSGLAVANALGARAPWQAQEDRQEDNKAEAAA